MEIAIPLYPRFTALDAVGPYEVLSRLPGARVRFVGAEAGPYLADSGMLALVAEASLDHVPSPDVVLVPGGVGTPAEYDGPVVPWIRRAHETARWTTSVCSGALLLARAGVLDGLEATTHWLDLEELGRLGARPVGDRRVVEAGTVITAAGVSSGIDMALVLAARIAGEEVAQAIQLGIEYDPQPPFDAGSTQKAPEGIQAMVRAVVAARGPV